MPQEKLGLWQKKNQKLDAMFGSRILNILVQAKLAAADRTNSVFPKR